MESLEERVTRARDDVEEAAESLAELEIQREDLIEPAQLQGAVERIGCPPIGCRAVVGRSPRSDARF